VCDSCNHCAVVNRLVQLSVFTGCSNGAVCVTSYIQCAQGDIFKACNIKDINKVTLYCLNIYYKNQNCYILGYYAASSCNLLLTIGDNLSVSLKGLFWHLVLVTYRRFETIFWLVFNGVLAINGNFLQTFRDNISVTNLTVILPHDLPLKIVR